MTTSTLLPNKEVYGPELSKAFYGSFEALNPEASEADLHELGEMIIGAVGATLPIYSKTNSPVEALQEGHNSVHCAGRSSLVHSLASPLLRFNSHIVQLEWGPESSHFFNLIYDTGADDAIIIENWVDGVGIHGLIELVTNPDDVTIVDPLLHAPVYRGAIEAARKLATFGNLANDQSFNLERMFENASGEDDGNPDGRLVHLRQEDMQTLSTMEDLGLEYISTSTIRVYDPIMSDDIADMLGYGIDLAA